jgi:hypothetical protein
MSGVNFPGSRIAESWDSEHKPSDHQSDKAFHDPFPPFIITHR